MYIIVNFAKLNLKTGYDYNMLFVFENYITLSSATTIVIILIVWGCIIIIDKNIEKIMTLSSIFFIRLSSIHNYIWRRKNKVEFEMFSSWGKINKGPLWSNIFNARFFSKHKHTGWGHVAPSMYFICSPHYILFFLSIFVLSYI